MPVGPKARQPYVISLDCESTGTDVYHASRPFFVTIAVQGQRAPYFWCWEVDPLTRMPRIDPADLAEIKGHIDRATLIIGQNIKFDVGMLRAAWRDVLCADLVWPWNRTWDTLIASHLLASNQPHDLTSLALQYLGADIKPAEDHLSEVCNAARRYARSHYPEWKIAKTGMDGGPSIKESAHKSDMWLPKALHDAGADVADEYATVLRDYSTVDSAITLALYPVMEAALRAHPSGDQTANFNESMRLPRHILEMERRGVSISRPRTRQMRATYSDEAETLGARMVEIAASMGHVITLPKAGRNQSIMTFAGSPTGLNLQLNRDECGPGSVFVPWDRRTETGNISLNKACIDWYAEELERIEPDGLRLEWLTCLKDKSSRDTAVTYMANYENFWIPLHPGKDGEGDWYVLHPSYNQTGTDTLRFTCKTPNAQNISEKRGFNLRYGFGPAPGREWWSMDFKNLELRLPFYKSGEQSLIDLFEHPDDAPFYGSNHLLNLSIVFPEIWDEGLRAVGPEKCGEWVKENYPQVYKQVKNGGFCKQYGGGRALTDATFKRKGAYDLLDSRFTKLTEYTRKQIAFANKWGYVLTMPDRTVDPKRGYPLLCTRTERGQILETVPLSYHIQGSAMWLTRRAMVKCAEQLETWRKDEGFDGFMTIQVHDEIVFDLPKSEIPPGHDASDENLHQLGRSNLWRARVLQGLMESTGDGIGVPTPVGLEYNPVSWSEAVSF